MLSWANITICTAAKSQAEGHLWVPRIRPTLVPGRAAVGRCHRCPNARESRAGSFAILPPEMLQTAPLFGAVRAAGIHQPQRQRCTYTGRPETPARCLRCEKQDRRGAGTALHHGHLTGCTTIRLAGMEPDFLLSAALPTPCSEPAFTIFWLPRISNFSSVCGNPWLEAVSPQFASEVRALQREQSFKPVKQLS